MKSHKIKLILVLSTILLLFFTSLSVYTISINMKRTVVESIGSQSLEAAKAIASDMDIEAYKRFLDNKVQNNHYWEIRSYLNDAREKLGALYVYTLELESPKEAKAMIVGLPPERTDIGIGEPCMVPEPLLKRAYYEEKHYVTGVMEDPKFGVYLSAGVPIKDEIGETIGYLGIDISAKRISEIEGTVLEDNIVIFIFNGVFILIIIASFFLMQRWYLKEVAKEVGDTEDTYQTEIKTLIASVSSLRHDFVNHIQVIHGLLMIGELNKALQYVSSLSKEVEVIKSIELDVEHPGLGILLQAKKLAAENQQIDMDISISKNAFDKIKTTDMIKILSNLIDNAIEATNELPEEKRKVVINCIADEAKYVFKIMNTGPKIIDDEIIFKQGYSTKKVEQGKTRGQGLFIIKEIVHKYNGTVSISSTNDLEITVIVEIPIK